MNRSERRAKARKIKGGCGSSYIRYPDSYESPFLKMYADAGKEIKKEKTLRSKQVPGY